MKKLSKNKFAKLFATFLGASTILTPIATLVSCEQLNKTPVTQEKPTNGGNNQNNGGNNQNNGGNNQNETETTEDITIGNSTISVTKKGENIIKATGTIFLNEIEELAQKSTNDIVINTDALTIKSFNDKGIIEVKEEDLQAVVNKLSVLNIDNLDKTKQNITLDKDANITSIKGNINLTDITQNISNSDKLTIAQFINKQIQKEDAKQITSDSLEIKSKETDKIKTNSLKKVTKKLSKTYITNTTSNGTQTVTLDKDANITSVTGNISLKDITENSNEETTEIAKYIAKNLKENSDTNFDSSNLTINTFYKKTTGRGAPSRDSSQINPEYTYKSTPITPKFLKETKQNALNKAVLNFKDSNEVMHVNFESYQGDTKEQKQNDYFDINEFSNEIEKGKLKNISASDIKGFIFLRGKKEKINGNDNYPEISKLVKISEKLGKKFTVGSVEISGNVGEILQKLINKEILEEEETGKSIKFIYDQNLCTTDFYTGYFGTKSNPNLSAEQIQEYYNRSDIMQLDDVTITGLNSENYKGNFTDNMLTNVNFKNSDLSKINFEYCTTGGGYLKFENTILPTNMRSSVVNTLILKNAKLPEELKETDPEDLPYRLPNIKNNLKIFNLELLNKWTEADLSTLDKVRHPPEKYVGPKNVWDKFKCLYLDEGTKTHFTNEDLTDTPLEDINFSSIQKQQSQLLALLQIKNKSRG